MLELQSGFNELLSLSLDELFDIQADIMKVIAFKVKSSLPQEEEEGEEQKGVNGGSLSGSKNSVKRRLLESQESIHGDPKKTKPVTEDIDGKNSEDNSIIEDSDDFIMTQFDPNVAKITSARTPQRYDDAFSSPLKQHLQESVIRDSQEEGITDTIVSEERIMGPPVEDGNDEKTQGKVDFNCNPITGAPWILEDFKPNNDVNNVRRGKQKLERFYARVGRPGERIRGDQTNHSSQHSDDSLQWEFDNLRHRSKSPPGFGRMDFPTTQERQEDKQQAQEIIRKKTLHRFMMATQASIPAYEREFVFKKSWLNDLVDDHNFSFSRASLIIFQNNHSKRPTNGRD